MGRTTHKHHADGRVSRSPGILRVISRKFGGSKTDAFWNARDARGGHNKPHGGTKAPAADPSPSAERTAPSPSASSESAPKTRAVARRSRVKSQTKLAPSGRAGLRTSVSITPGRSAIGIN